MSIHVIERDVTKSELDRMKAGFEEHALEHGVAPENQVRYGFVALDGDKFIGCVSGLTSNKWFYISDLWLEKEYRGQGLGATLLEKLEDVIFKSGVRNIYTWTAGYEAPPFYKKQGYHVFCEQEDYYSTGHSRFGFRKTLNLS